MKLFDTKKKKIIAVAAAGGVVLLAGVAVLLIFLLFPAETVTGYRSIKIDSLHGIVQVANKGETPYDAYESMHLYDGFSMSTRTDSYSRMLLDDDKYTKLEENSLAMFEGLEEDSKLTAITLSYGSMTNEVVKPLGEGEDYKVTTPNAVLSVRGTMFRTNVGYDENAECVTDIYTYGGTVLCNRIMPDGSIVEENTVIDAGFKATIKMDNVLTVYVEEFIENGSDHVDPIVIPDIPDDDIVDMYVASSNGHTLFMTTQELIDEILRREIDLTKYVSYIDGKPVRLPEPEETTFTTTTTAAPPPVTVTTVSETSGTAEVSFEEQIVEITESEEPEETGDEAGDGDGEGEGTGEGEETGEPAPITEASTYDTTVPPAPVTLPTSRETTPTAPISLVTYEWSYTEPMTVPTYTTLKEWETAETIVITESDEPERTTSTKRTTGTEISIVTHTQSSSETTVPVTTVPVTTSPVRETTTTTPYAVSTINYVSSQPIGTTERVTAPPDMPTPQIYVPVPDVVPVVTDTPSSGGGDSFSNCRHTSTEVVYDMDATCEENGYSHTVCKKCRAVLSIDEIPALGHDWNAPVFRWTASDGAYSCSAYFVCRRDSSHTHTAECDVTSVYDETSGTRTYTAVVTLDGTEYRDMKTVNSDGTEGVGINALNYPDEVFRAYVTDNFDKNGNGFLDSEEIKNSKEILLGDYYKDHGVASFKGIEYLTELETLYCHCNYSLSELDVTKNTKLKTLHCAYCPISYIDLGKNTELEYVDIGGTKITSFDLSASTKLERLYIGGLPVSYLDTSVFPQLRKLDLHDTKMLSLDLSGNKLLDFLRFDECRLAFVDVSGNDAMEEFWKGTNIHPVTLSAGNTFDLSTIKGFDVSRMSNIIGATLSGTVLTFAGDEVSYTYDCGQGYSETFTLKAENGTGDGIPIDYEHFPDDYFRQYIGSELDIDKNGYLSDGEIAMATDIDVEGKRNVSSLAGLKYFTALKYLSCNHTSISALDVSGNTALEGLYCNNTGITSVDVSKNTALKYLICCGTGITALDVSRNVLLEDLNCRDTGITSLDVSNNTALKILDCDSTAITSLDVSHNPYLEELYCRSCNAAYFDISDNSAIKQFYVWGNTYRIADGSSFDLNGISGFDVSRMSNLSGATLSGTVLTFTDGEVTYTYDCGQGRSETFTLKADSYSPSVPPSGDGIPIDSAHFPDDVFRAYVSEKFDKDSNSYLSDEEIKNAGVIEIPYRSAIKSLEGLQYFKYLAYLDCYDSGVTSIDVSSNTALWSLDCGEIDITSIDISNNTNLSYLNCSGTNISSLDVSNNTALEKLWCHDTKVSSLDLSNNTVLKLLYCNNTNILSLDVSYNTALEILFCGNTDITSLDLNNNTALKEFSCSGTNISSLNLSNNTGLERLYCDDSRIAYVDISNNPAVYSGSFFVIRNNKHPIPNADTFDLNRIKGFDGNRIVEGTLTGAKLDTFSNMLFDITGDVTYKYDCKGNGDEKYYATFTLVPTEGITYDNFSTVSADTETVPDTGTGVRFPEKITRKPTPPAVYISQAAAYVLLAAGIVVFRKLRSNRRKADEPDENEDSADD